MQRPSFGRKATPPSSPLAAPSHHPNAEVEGEAEGQEDFGDLGSEADSEHGQNLLARMRREDQDKRCCCFSVHLGTEKKRKRSVRQELIDVFVFRAVPICPDSKFSSRWLGLLLVAVMYTILYVPYAVAWPAAVPLLPWVVFDMIVGLVFILDVGLNFITSYMNQEEDEWEVDFTKCAKHYLTGWFIVDLVASFPYDVVVIIVEYSTCGSIVCQDENGNTSYGNALQMLKLLRLLRVTKLVKYIASRSLSVTSSLMVLVCSFVLLAHLFACLWWLVSVLENLPDVNWVALQSSIPDLAQQPVSVQYSTCIYWAVVTTATLGYGDVTAKTYPEEIYSILVILFGAMFYTVVVGLVQQLVAWKFSTGAEYNQWMDRVTLFCDQNKLHKEMRSKLTGYYRYVWERRKTFRRETSSTSTSSNSFMNDLPFELKIDVADNLHAKLFRNNPVFQNSQMNFKHYLATKLGPGQLKLPDEVLFFEGEPAESLILVRDGLLELVVSIGTEHNLFGNILVNEHDELVVSSRAEGQYCGDLGLFTNQVNFVSCVVAQFSDIHIITANDFLAVLESFPQERALFERVAEQREERITNLVATFRRFMTCYCAPGEDVNRAFISKALNMTPAQIRFTPAPVLQAKLEQAMWQLWEKDIKPEEDDKLCEAEISVYYKYRHSTEDTINDPIQIENKALLITGAREASSAASSQRSRTTPSYSPSAQFPTPPPTSVPLLDGLVEGLEKQVAELEERIRASRRFSDVAPLPDIPPLFTNRQRPRAHTTDDM
ncbi:hypothetical protein BASA81_007512 [Batrachochytrium salamandrivorans]|nr:hypothetical protein BASA81_007512 [Batrachochytrium salamandrivorans]